MARLAWPRYGLALKHKGKSMSNGKKTMKIILNMILFVFIVALLTFVYSVGVPS